LAVITFVRNFLILIYEIIIKKNNEEQN
jgi:hypothetical protein